MPNMDIERISLNIEDRTGDDEKIDLTETPQVGKVPADMLDHTVGKTSFATGREPEDIKESIVTGQEDFLRDDLVAEQSLKQAQLNASILEEFTNEKAAKGEAVTQQETDFILNLTKENISNPKTIVESQYAEKATTTAVSQEDRPEFFSKLMAGDPETEAIFDGAVDAVTKKEIAQKAYDGLQAEMEDLGLGGKIYEHFETFLPFFSSSNLKDAVKDAPTSSFLPGNNLQEQAEYLYLLPPDEFQKEFQQAVDQIAESNLVDAATFAAFVGNYSKADVLLQNVFGAIDVLDVAGLAVSPKLFKLARNVVKKGVTSTSLKPFVKEMSKRVVNEPDVLAASGNVETASILKAIERIKTKVAPLDATGGENLAKVLDDLPAVFNVQGIFRGSSSISGARAQKVVEMTELENAELLEGLADAVNINRLDGAALRAGLIDSSEAFNRHYPQLSNHVLEVSHTRIATPDEKNLANVDGLLVRLGNKENDLFDTIEQAEVYARDIYKLKDSRIVQQGPDRFYIEVFHEVDETAPVVRQALIETDNDVVKSSLANRFFGLLRTADDLVSKTINDDRTAVTYGGQAFLRFFKNSAKQIGKLNKDQRGALLGFIDRQKNFVKAGEVGRTSKSSVEFEKEWSSLYGRMPDEKEQLAYWNFVRLNDIDYMLNNFSILRDKSRAGLRDFDLRVSGVGDDITEDLLRMEGKQVDDIPWDAVDDAGIVILNDDLALSQFHRKNSRGGATFIGDTTDDVGVSFEETSLAFKGQSLRDTVNDLKGDGYSIIQLSPKGENTLKGHQKIKEMIGDEEVNYVLVKNATSNPLGIRQLPHRPGFHIVYPDGFFVRQPNVKRLVDSDGVVRHRYDGDYNLLNFSTRKEALAWEAKVDKARVLLKEAQENNNFAAYTKYVNENLPYKPKEFAKKFRDGFLDVNTPFRTTFSGSSVKDNFPLEKTYENLTVKADSSHNLYKGQVNLEFAAKRNPPIQTIANRGSEDLPDFNLELAKQLDIFETSDQALSSLLRTRILSDMQIKSTEHWAAQFGDILDIPKEELRRNPVAAISNPKYIENTDNTLAISAAKNARRALLQLVGQENEVSKTVSWLQQQTMERLNVSLGKTGSDQASVNPALMGFIKDPGSYFRAAAFHMKLGFMNPVQFWLQAQTFTHIIGLSPRNAMSAMPAYWYSRMLNMTAQPQMLDDAARRVAAISDYKAEHFKESHEALMRSGFFDVGQEVAWKSDMLNPNLTRTKAGVFLDKTSFFFNEGERVTRLTAWHTAYLDWRKANPLASLDAAAERQIMSRADLMTVNMTQKSNAAWSTGIASIPTQFWSYQARLGEQIFPGVFGKGRLTQAEAIRSMGVHSMMYGVPIGITGTTVGALWPFWEEIRQGLLERDVDLSDDVWEGFMEGLPALGLSTLTGQEFNFGERYGPGGLSTLKDWWSGDATVLETLFGVSGSVLQDTVGTMEPLLKALTATLDDTDNTYPISVHDFADPLSNISSINQARKAWYAVNYGIYISRNETLLGKNVGVDEGIFQAMFGLQRQETSDAFLKLESLKELKDLQNETRKDYIREIRRGLRADSPEDAIKFFKRARTHAIGGGFLPNEYSGLLSSALDGQGDLVDKVGQKFREKIINRNIIKKQIDDNKRNR